MVVERVLTADRSTLELQIVGRARYTQIVKLHVTLEALRTAVILNCTLPVAVLGEMVAVKLTESPNVDGFLLDATVVIEPAATIEKFFESLLPLWLASPPYEALAVAVPALTLLA